MTVSVIFFDISEISTVPKTVFSFLTERNTADVCIVICCGRTINCLIIGKQRCSYFINDDICSRSFYLKPCTNIYNYIWLLQFQTDSPPVSALLTVSHFTLYCFYFLPVIYQKIGHSRNSLEAKCHAYLQHVLQNSI